jgi:hypothetical protein
MRLHPLFVAAWLAIPSIAAAAAPTSLDFDNVAVDGGGYSLGSSPRVFDSWTVSLLSSAGANVTGDSFLDISANSGDSPIIAGGGDKALSASGEFGIVKFLQLAATDGSEFKLNSFVVSNPGFMAPNLQVIGYRDSSQVATQNFTSPQDGSVVTVTLSGSAWQYIDAFRIVQQDDSSDIQFWIDDVSVSAGIPPNTAPTLTTINTLTGATEDTAFSITYATLAAAANEADADGDTLSFRIESVSTGTLTKNGSAVTAGVTLLSTGEQLVWTPASHANGTLNAFTVRAWDGTAASASPVQVQVSVSAVNDAPTATNLTQSKAATEGGSAVALDDIVVTDVDTGDTITATLTLSDPAAGSLSTGTFGSATSTYNAGTGVWTVTGSVTDINAALAAVALTPSANNDQNFTITTRIRDGADTGPADGTISVTVTPVNDAPVVTTSGGTSVFTEGGSATVIDSGLTLSDVDSATLASATVTITGNFASGQDVLAFTNDGSTMGNISASYNASTGVMTLTSAGGTATLAQWQTALRSVTYSNSSEAPSTSNRTISFTVNDGDADSVAATKSVSVTSTNTAPTVTAPATISVTEDVATALTGISFSDADSGGGSVTATLSVDSGTFAASSGGGVTVSGSGTSSVTLTGTVANLNAFIAGSNVTFTSAANALSDVTLTSSINDNGNTGAGGAKSASTTTTLQISAVNDAPVVTTPVSIAVVEDVTTALTGISFADVDAGGATVTATFAVGSGSLSATSGSGVTVGGTSSTRTLSGSIADLNAFIAASTLTFTTATNATSNVVLTVTIDDGGNTGSGGAKSDTDTVTLTVTAVNDAPVNTVPGIQTVNQDSALVFSSDNSNAIAVADVDAGGGTVRVTLTATNGKITLSGTTGLSFIVGSGANDATMTFEATLAQLNTALNGLVFTPTPGFNGGAGLEIATSDLGLSGSGGTQTDTDLIEIEVLPINPVVTSVGSTSANGAYKIGDTLSLTVTFDQTVTVNTTGGTPSLLLETGTTDRSASYTSGSGSTTLTFTYTVEAGDASPDLDYASTSALAFNGATIRNATNNDAILTLPTVGGANSIAGQHALVIDGIAPVITSGSSASATFGEAFSGYTITATDTTAVSYAATGLPPGLSAHASTGAITGTPTAAGTYVATISATDAIGNPSTAPLTFGVGKAAATVTLGGLMQTYDGSAKAATVTTNPSGLAVAVTYAGSATIPTSAGTYAVVATIDDPNHQGSVSGTLQVAQASQTVSFPPVGAVTIGQPIALSATASSGLAVTFSLVTGPASLTGSTLTVNESSSVMVRAIQAGNHNYLPATADLTITDVGKLAQTITFTPLPDQPATGAPFGLSATASSGLPVTFTVLDGPAMLSGATLSLTAVPGTVTVRASQAGNATYLAAPDVTQSFAVAAVGPLVYFGTLGNGETARQVAAQLSPDGKSGTMIGIVPGTGEGFVVDFAPGPDGRWTATVTTISGGTSLSAPSATALALDTAIPRERFGAAKAASLTTFTRTFRGTVSGSVLTGTIDELGLTFTTSLQPPVGPTSEVAGYYEAPSLNSAIGSTHVVVGTQGQVYALIISASAVAGNGGTVTAHGVLSIQTPEGASVSGTVSAHTSTLSGKVTLPGGINQSFSGVRETTLRTDRLVNLSTRALFSGRGGEDTVIAGFVIGGSTSKRVLLRGIGPTLTPFGVKNPLVDPRLRVFNGQGQVIAENDNWGGDAALAQVMQRVGAFALPVGSKDAALLLDLAPGPYTVHVLDSGQTGIALAEIYDASENPNGEYQRLINISSRGYVGTGEGILIGGFVVTGNAPKRVLVRGSGPALTRFGLQNVLNDPQIRLFNSDSQVVAANDNWQTPAIVDPVQTSATAAEIAAASQAAGAFALADGSKDAALVVTLAPGAYTVHVSGLANTTGVALVEIYEITP